MTSESKFRWINAAVVLGTIALDQVTKQIAAALLSDAGRLTYLGDILRLQYAENSGAFLSLGARLSPGLRLAIFTVGGAILVFVCARAALHHRGPRWQQSMLWLMAAGGASNLIDRFLRGRVIDFMNLGLGPVRTGIFNFADVALMTGLIALFLGGGFKHHPEPDPAPSTNSKRTTPA